jgi:hypothetical protein
LQSLFSSTANPINFIVDGGFWTYGPGNVSTQPIVDVDNATTAGGVFGILVEGLYVSGGPNPTVPFSNTLITNVVATGSLEFVGVTGRQNYRPVSFQNSINPAAVSGTINVGSTDKICWRNFANNGDICFIHSNNASNWLDASQFPLTFWTQLGSNSASAATSGFITLAGVDVIAWRNAANSLNLNLSRDSSDGLSWSGNSIRAKQLIADQGTACTNGELALSAGWGATATVTAVAGTGQTCHWTITSAGAGQAANPTITDTLTNALPSASTICDMRMEGGTGTPTLIQQTTLSATAPVFTFQGTPVAASTYIIVRRCGP